MGRRCASDVEATLEVYVDYRVPLCLAHLVEDAVAQDARVVHHCIDLAVGVDCLLDHSVCGVPVGNGVCVQHRLATVGVNCVNHLLARADVLAFAGGVAAQVVDHYLRALLSHQ